MVSINTISIGAAPDDGNGDPLRTSFDKSNTNDANLNAGLALSDANISSLQADASSLNASVSSLGVRAGSIETSVASLSTRIGSVDTRIGSVDTAAKIESVIVALSDETTDVSAGSAKATFRAPFAMTLTDVRAHATLPTSGSKAQFDVNVAGTSVFSAALTMDAGELTSTTAESSFILASAAIADDDQIVIDVDSVGATAAGQGFKVTLIGTR